MAHLNMEDDKMLDVYIYDYLMKRKCINSAKIFQREAHISAKSSAMDVPGGFLYEWWSIFWATYIARYQQQSSKTEEQVDQPKLQKSSQQQWLEQMQMQRIVQQQYQQKQRDNIQIQSNTTANSNTARPNLAFTNALARKKILQQKSNENANQLSNATHATLTRSTASEIQIPWQLPYDASLSNLNYFLQVKDPKQQNMINPATCLRLPGADGSLDRVTESDQDASNFPLEGWPLSVLEQQILKSDQWHRERFQSLQSLGQQLDHPKCRYQQPDKVDAAGSNSGCDAVSNTSRDYSQAKENQILRKRKQATSALDPAKRLGTGNAGGVQKSTSMLSINEVGQHADISSNTHVFCSGSFGPQASATDQLADSDNSGSLAHNVESFLSSSNPETKNTIAACLEANQDKTFSEVGSIHANLVNHCDFSYDGKLIATSGNDEKIMLWSVDSRDQKYLMEEHSAAITDIRFCPRLLRMGSSSVDKTIKIWNANNVHYAAKVYSKNFFWSLCPVLSLDFHPKEEDLVCSCDDATEIRYWSIKSGGCTGLSKADVTQVRFQCIHGKYLAAAVQNGASIINVETAQTYGYSLQGHATNVISVCWNPSGEYMASLSEDLIRVWKIGSGEMQQCVHELSISTKKFQCCLFLPSCPLSLVIGFNQSMDIWHVAENKMITVLEQPINALAVSQYPGLVASVSDGNLIKLWK